MATYSDVREKLKSGDMVLWAAEPEGYSQHDMETHLVKMATESQWTHVGVLWVEHGRVFVMDLTTKGCAPRPLSEDLPVFIIPSPAPLSEMALRYAFSRFGRMVYSKWQALLGFMKRLTIGDDMSGECAEFVLEVYGVDGIAPTQIATPRDCFMGAMMRWKNAGMFPVVPDLQLEEEGEEK